MPSGAKKRKAAKKKKENQPNNIESQPPHSHGDEDDSKHQSQEDKDSDVGEVEVVDTKETQIEGIKQQKPTEEENWIQVERELNIEEESSTKNGSSKNIEGSSRSSSSNSNSSSDDESHDEAKISAESVAEASDSLSEKPTEETADTVSAKSPVIGSEKIPSLSEKAEVVSFEGDSSLNPRSAESVIEEDNQEKQHSVKDKADRSIGSSEIARSVEENEEEVLDPNECIAQESDKNLAVSYNATKPTGDIGVVSEPDSGFTLPYIANPPHPVQTTSWKSCCGLFELFTGPGR